MKKFTFILLFFSITCYAGDDWDYSIPNVSYLHRTTNKPWDIHVLIIDLKNPGCSLRTVLSNDQIWGREVVSSMALRHNADAAINGDFSGFDRGIPEGLTVIDNEIMIAPKFRTALGFTENFSAITGMWTDRWNWYAQMSDSDGNEHDIVMMNLDFNQDWMCLYTDIYGHATPGNSVSNNVVEIVVNADSQVTEIRTNQSGTTIPSGYFVISGREGAANWLTNNITLNEYISLKLITVPDWRNLWQAVSGGPRIIKDGQYYADPIATFPNGEDFTLSFKNSYYNTRHPRSAAGVTINGDTLILAVVDGRQSHSVGMTLHELADLLLEFDAWQGLQFDSGGSATFFYNGHVQNQPSDGSERAVANSLCIFSKNKYINIAPQATILSFSEDYPPAHTIDKLIDGKRHRNSSKWVDLNSDTPWVEIDLGKIYPLTHYQLFHGSYLGDPAYLNTTEFEIYSRKDSTTSWHLDFFHRNNDFQPADNLLTFVTPFDARYVKLRITQSNYLDYEDILRLPEFSIYIQDTTLSHVQSEKTHFPNGFQLHQNYPNPFNPETTIKFTIPGTELVTLTIYNLNGEKIKKLVEKNYQAGTHTLKFKADHMASGIYIAEMKAGQFRRACKMILLR